MMASKQQRTDLIPVPMLLHESLYVGIDVGKAKHVAGFVSTTILERHQRFEPQQLIPTRSAVVDGK
jgi:hypothetical protein